MKNTLGHDNDSEIITIIARLREKKFNVIAFSDNTIVFEIVLIYRITVPVPNTRTQKIRFTINRLQNDSKYDYYIKQLNGINERIISFVDGYIIWNLLEEAVM